MNQIYSYELLNKLPLGMGQVDIESIEYDKVNNEYLTASWYFGVILPFTEQVIEDSEYNFTDTRYLSTFNGFPVNIWRQPEIAGGSGSAGLPFDNGDLTLNTETWRPAGMEIIDRTLYIVDFYFGRFAGWDLTLDTQTYTQSLFVTNTEGDPAQLDGLCHDPDNPSMLYSTDFGYNVNALGEFHPTGNEAVYAINTDDWTWERIYDVDMTVEGAEDAGSDYNYTIRANGCVVVDGILYTVDSDMKHEQPQGFCQYDIEKEQWSVEFELLPEGGGDGLVYINEIKTFFSTDFENGTLSRYNPRFDDKFEIVYDGMVSPADMTYNAEERVLAIPELYTGFVNFIQLEDVLFATTEYFTTTEYEATQADNTEMMRVMMTFCVSIVMTLI